MGIFSWIFSKATGGVIEAVGTAVNKNIRTLKGDKAEVEAAVHDEQMAVLAEHAAEFVSRPTRTKLDSFIDFLNRLPRPIITFWIFAIFTWPAIDADSFMRYVLSMELIPDGMWQIAMVVLSLYFGGRILSQDIRKPKLSPEQRERALETIREREEAIIEARIPLIVEVPPTSKPPPPQWAQDILAKPIPEPIFKPQPDKTPVKGRPADVDRMIDDIIKVEGGYVNDPSDSGGPTRYGITHKTLSAWRGTMVGEPEVMALTKEEAADIYRAEFYFGPSIDSLPLSLQAHVLDFGINAGPRTAIKMLQKVLNSLGADLKEDGIIGPETRDAVSQYDVRKINNTLVGLRLKFYTDLAARRPKDRRFLAGWQKRANGFLVA